MNVHEMPQMRYAIETLRPHPANARRGNLPVIMESLRTLGQFRPIVVNIGTHTGRPNEILAGHHLVAAARELGWTTVVATLLDVDDETATRILLADNRTSDLATYDDRLLLEVLTSLPNLDGTGYEPGDIEALEALLRDHPWEDQAIQDVLDRADEDAWPEVRCKLAPHLHELFLRVPGADDAQRITTLLEKL